MGKAPEVHELRQYICLINVSAEGTNKSNALLANEDFEAEGRQEQDTAVRQGQHPSLPHETWIAESVGPASAASACHFVMAGLVPAIHVFTARMGRRGCPAQGRA
jgi:hypothetical protein